VDVSIAYGLATAHAGSGRVAAPAAHLPWRKTEDPTPCPRGLTRFRIGTTSMAVPSSMSGKRRSRAPAVTRPSRFQREPGACRFTFPERRATDSNATAAAAQSLAATPNP
jgi:hypothetical protein